MNSPYFDDEIVSAVSALSPVTAGVATADAVLVNRVLYGEWAAYRPEHADELIGDVMSSMEKYVPRRLI